jgi:hypothetical protein
MAATGVGKEQVAMVSVTVPFSAAALVLAEMPGYSGHCRCRVGVCPSSGARILVKEGNPALVIPREWWDAAFGVPVELDRDAGEWDQQWRAWPLSIDGQIARFDEWVLIVSEAMSIKETKSEP